VAKRTKLTGNEQIELSIRIPTEIEYFCRGFYQIEEDILYVPIYPSGRFYSYLDSIPQSSALNENNNLQPLANLDIDSEGRLLFLQIKSPRRHWNIIKSLNPSSSIEPADIRFINFRENIRCFSIDTTNDFSMVKMTFSSITANRSYRAGDNLIFDVTDDNSLAAIWITSITDDRAAKLMSEWRKEMRTNHKSENTKSSCKRIEINK
jgi:hypothetical protein